VYDLHAHILPGVDDGAKTPEDTIAMARVAADSGTRTILATPHRKDVTENWSVQHIRELVAEMNRRIRSEGIELELVLGMENHLDLDLPDEVARGRALPMNGTRYILVEMPFFGRPNYIEDVLFKLQLQGLTPVLAHPERIEAFQQDVELLASFVERGMLSQITAGSLLGHFSGPVKRFTHTLLRRGLAHIIASDTHHPDGPRSPLLHPGVEAAAGIVGAEGARAMAVDTPRAVLEDKPVKLGPPGREEQPRRWWKFWA
jgi:protein-tyrosine phosphatase